MVGEEGEEEEGFDECWEGCCERQRVTAGSVEWGEGVERETWPRILGGLVAVASSVSLSAAATHAASVEGEERNSIAWETPWTG